MHRKSDSVFGTLKNTLETTNVYQKPSTTNKQHTKQQKTLTYQKISNAKIPIKQTLKFQNSKIQKSKNPKIQNPKAPTTQKPPNPKTQKSQNPKLFTSTESCIFYLFGCLNFWIFRFSQSLPNNCYGYMGKMCVLACRRGAEHIYIYVHVCVYIYGSASKQGFVAVPPLCNIPLSRALCDKPL